MSIGCGKKRICRERVPERSFPNTEDRWMSYFVSRKTIKRGMSLSIVNRMSCVLMDHVNVSFFFANFTSPHFIWNARRPDEDRTFQKSLGRNFVLRHYGWSDMLKLQNILNQSERRWPWELGSHYKAPSLRIFTQRNGDAQLAIFVELAKSMRTNANRYSTSAD